MNNFLETRSSRTVQKLQTLVDILSYQGNNLPEKTAYTFLQDGENPTASITFGELDRRARAIAVSFQAKNAFGERAVLLYPPGLDFITAFFGCLYSGVIPVPAYPPRRNRNLVRLQSIVSDAQAKYALTNTILFENLKTKLERNKEFSRLQLLTTDRTNWIKYKQWQKPELEPNSLAFLQYTSGSTGNPKGVMVSHRNLIHNLKMIQTAFEHDQDTIFVGWLPLFHDMGLVGNVLQPLYLGIQSILMSPTAFLQKPIRWLQAISDYEATTAGGPNFAYDLCVAKITPEQKVGLDLSSWNLAFSGAESIRAETLNSFCNSFADCGFQPAAFYPCYGMAESTLLITGGDKAVFPKILSVEAVALEQNNVIICADEHFNSRKIVSCGKAWLDETVTIVNPETLKPCLSKEVGEIWVSSSSVANGYWNQPEKTRQTFNLSTADDQGQEHQFLRTGDLGFLHEGELFITGRLKDIIIVRGRNHYPQDIELTVQQSHPRLRANCGAVFTVEIQGSERLFVAQELERSEQRKIAANPALTAEIMRAIRQQIAECHELEVYGILLLKTASLPKTSSGKIQRQACRQGFETRTLKIVAQSLADLTAEDSLADIFEFVLTHDLSTQDLSAQLLLILKTWVGKHIGLELNEIDFQQRLTSLGLDSLGVIELATELENNLGIQVSLSKIFEAADLPKLAENLAQKLTEQREQQEQPEKNQLLNLPPIIPDRQNCSQPFPLTNIQQAYWLGRGNSFGLGNITTHIYLEFQCQDLEIKKLTQAWQQLIDRHEMLRAIVLPTGEQKILDSVDPYSIKINRLTNTTEIESQLEDIRANIQSCDRSSEQWPLFEIQASKLSQSKWRLHLYFDLLIADSWSLLNLLQEWSELYANSLTKPDKLAVTFRDYVIAEQQLETTEIYRQSQNYWLQRLDKLPPAPDLPVQKTSGDLEQPDFDTRRARLSAQHWQVLKQRARALGVTPSGLLITVFAEVLALWSRRSHFSLNLTLYNRLPLHPQIEQIVGDFTSLIPLEVNFTEQNTAFSERARQLQAQLWQDLEHRYFDGIRVQREFVSRGKGTTMTLPIVFTSLLGLPQFQKQEDTFDRFLGELVYNINPTAQVWLNHQVWEESKELVYSWDAVKDLFPPNMVDDMFGTYGKLLESLASSEALWQAVRPQEIPLFHQFLWQNYNSSPNGIKATAQPIQEDCSIQTEIQIDLNNEMLQTLFVKSANLYPDQCAVISPDRHLTYSDLLLRAQQVRDQLKQMGASPNKLIAVVMNKGWEQVVAVLGILLSGAAYVPISPDLPQIRLWQILAQAQVEVVLTQANLASQIIVPENVNCLSVTPTDLSETAFAQTTASLNPAIQQPEDLAYVIYTSGSTGTPKGVAISHRGAVNTVLAINELFNVEKSDRLLALSSLNFDLSVYDIFGILAAGGTIVFPNSLELKNPKHWLNLLKQHNITIWNSVPMQMQMLTEYLTGEEKFGTEDLRTVMLSGDYIPLKLPLQIKNLFAHAEVISLGGATEASIWSIFYPIQAIDDQWKTIPYGHPLPQQSIYVLDQYLELCPIWVAGLIYIGGAGVAKEYWGDEARTQSSFLIHPRTGERLYRTGDWGRLCPDGEVEFLGREDFQVKLNGYRIELGEIEAVINQHAQVQNSVVIVWQDNLVAYLVPCDQQTIKIQQAVIIAAAEELSTNKCLIAYIVRESESAPSSSKLRQYLLSKLPEYMVPSRFVSLESFPLIPNGKVDRRALPEPDGEITREQEYVAPRNNAEQILVKIWEEILGIQRVSIHDNFFELGGDSLLAIQVLSKAKQEKMLLNLNQIFQHQTISELANIVDTNQIMKVKSSEITDYIPIKLYQKKLLENSYSHLNLLNIRAFSFEYPQWSDPYVFKKSLKELSNHHDTLRIRFIQIHDSWKQIIAEVEENKIFYFQDLSELSPENKQQKIIEVVEELQHGINISNGPLFKVVFFKLGAKQQNKIIFIISHLVYDLISLNILFEDLQTAYQQISSGRVIKLPPKTTSYKFWMERLLEYSKSKSMLKEREYWLETHQKYDYKLPLNWSKEASKRKNVLFVQPVVASLSIEETEILFKKITVKYHIKFTDILLTALVKAFMKWTGKPYLLIRLSNHGRYPIFEDVDLSRSVGFFAMNFPVLLNIENSKSIEDELKCVKRQLSNIPNHGIGYSVLRDLSNDIEFTKKSSSISEPEVRFNYIGQTYPDSSNFPLITPIDKAIKIKRPVINTDSQRINISLSMKNKCLQMQWWIINDDSQRLTIEKLAYNYVQALQSFTYGVAE